MRKTTQTSPRPVNHTKNLLVVGILSLLYLLLSFLLTGLRTDHYVLVGLFAGFYLPSPGTRRFIIGFSIFILYWILFDYMKAFPNYHFHTVHIQDLYEVDKRIFGFEYHGTRVSPNEYFLINHNRFLDILAGIFYLNWIPLPLLFGIYLFYKNRRQFFYFSLAFFMVNILGFIIYYSYPAAPPWYVQQHGFVFSPGTPGSIAGLARFDDLIHIHLFGSIYSKSSNVFAAMPSLHCAYPMVVLYYGIKNRLGTINFLFMTIMLGIWFSAIYSSHHYVLDVMAGIMCAVAGLLFFEVMVKWNPTLQRFIDYMMRISSEADLREKPLIS